MASKTVTGPMSVYCYSCNARPGQRCFSKNNKVCARYHTPRLARAKELKLQAGEATKG